MRNNPLHQGEAGQQVYCRSSSTRAKAVAACTHTPQCLAEVEMCDM